MTSRILINVPRLDMPGGVANFYRVVREHLEPRVQYFEIGATGRESGLASALLRGLSDYWGFHRTLSTGDVSLVHLNPSLVPKSLVRDAFFLLLARAHAVPVLVFFRGWNDGVFHVVKSRMRSLFRKLLNQASGIIVLAEKFREELKAVGVDTPIFRLTTCVDDEVFEVPISRHESDGQLRVLFLSRLDEGKGLSESIKSFAVLKRARPTATLKIAGEGPERKLAERLAKELKLADVEFLGHVEGDDKRQILLASDIFLFPTFLTEGMPTVVLEAMAYGLPVVTRPVAGLQDFFENERMGFMTESRNPDDFGQLLTNLAGDRDLRRRIGDYNRAYAQRHFSASAVAGNLTDIYEKITA